MGKNTCDSDEYFYVIDDSWILCSTSAHKFNLCSFTIIAKKKKNGHIKWLLVNKVQIQTDSSRISSHQFNSSRQGAKKGWQETLLSNYLVSCTQIFLKFEVRRNGAKKEESHKRQ